MKVLLAALATVLGVWLLLNLLGALFVGFIARKIFPARDKVGWPMILLIGFLGGIVGKVLFFLCGLPRGLVMGFIASIVGAFLLLLVYHIRVSMSSRA